MVAFLLSALLQDKIAAYALSINTGIHVLDLEIKVQHMAIWLIQLHCYQGYQVSGPEENVSFKTISLPF